MGTEGLRVNRTSVHIHGGLVPWTSDGGPFSWFDDAGGYGTSIKQGNVNLFGILNPSLQAGQAEYYYPNNQSARLMWYHDHAVGITRLNAYSGIASAYIIRDVFEAGLRSSGLPDFIENGGREIPIIVQDKIFVGSNIGTTDPSWTGHSTPGSLWYPHVYETDRWGAAPGTTQPAPSAIPEMFGDTMLANGLVFPKVNVEPRRYRLRILNACQARFLNLQLYEDNGSGQANLASSGPDWLVIGADGGFLAKPARVASNLRLNFLPDGTTVDMDNPGGSLITGPAERWDIIIDFSGHNNKRFILYNDAPAPFPAGGTENDYQTANYGPDTRTIMRFDVGNSVTAPGDTALTITTDTPLALNPASEIDPCSSRKLDYGAPGSTCRRPRPKIDLERSL